MTACRLIYTLYNILYTNKQGENSITNLNNNVMKKKFTFLLIALLACLGVKAQDVVEISTVDELKAFRDAVNGGNQYAGQTVKLTADLDLSSESNWTPIGNLVSYPGQSFNGTFDGQGHTISNLTCTDNTPNYAVAGLFGSIVSGTIKNLTVKNVNLNSLHYAAGIVAYTSNTPTIENCHVIGGTIKSTPELINGSYDNGDKAGGIMGYATAGSTINNCTVQDVTISAYRDFGGIVGFSAGSVTNNTAIDVSLEQNLTHDYKSPNTPTTFDYILGRNGGATLDNNVVKNSICKIGDTKYISIADAVAAAFAGDVIKIFKAGTYTLPGISNNVTIEGTVDGVEFTHTSAGSVASIPNGCTFKNITFNFGNVNYHGFQHAGTINMEGCMLNGKFFSYGDMNFTDCEFNQTNADYHMWAYAGNLVYTDCTFTNSAEGKFINVFNEGGATKYTVTANNCKFVNNAASSSKAALNVKVTCGDKSLQYDVYVNNCTTEGAFPEVSKSDALYVLNSVVQVDDRKAAVEDRITVTENGVLIYPVYVAQYKDTKYTSLQAALDAAEADDKPNISIDLLDDATLDINAWSGTGNSQAIGTTNTQSITINGNSHKLTFMTKNTDWNNIATMNDSQTKLILNNMTIDQGGVNTKGTWNSYDINFNCAVELNNVTAKRALAFKNSATLKDVTVNQAGGSSDVYGIWISPRVENQTINIDGLKLTASAENGKTGRGIKVDDQYVTNNGGTVYKVTLNIANSTFSTEAKAAILLKAAEGVDVIDGGGNIIENVAADNVNLVWVDESRAAEYYKYSLTSTSGATMVPEKKESDYVVRLSNPDGKIMGYYKGTDAIANAVAAATADGYTATIFQTGEYTMPDLPHNITIETAEGVKGVVFNHTGSGNIASIPNGATFKNLTFNFGNVDYHGFQHAGTINMEGCTLNGKFFSYGDMNFTNCEFNQTNADYHMWVYGPSAVRYTSCTFTNEKTGKFLNIYREGPEKNTVYIDKCKFVNNGSVNKAATNVKATCTKDGNIIMLAADVYITESTTEGAFPAETITQPLVVLNNLAQVDDRTATGVDNITVTHDGVLIYPLAPVAKIGEIGYPTLQLAVDAATVMGGDVTINIVADITGETVTIKENANLQITIDGKKDDSSNYTVDAIIVVDGLRGNGGSNTNGASVTLQNIAFVRGEYLTTQNADVIQPCHYPHHLTIQDCTYTGTDTDTSRDKWFLNVSDAPMYNATIKNVTVEHSRLIQGNLGMDVVFENITAINDIKSGFNIKTEGTVLIKNCQITTPKYAFRDYKDAYVGTITLEGNTFISTSTESDEGAIVNRGGSADAKINVVSGTYVGDIKPLNGKNAIVISGGHFSAPIYEDAYADYIADGLTGIKNLYPEDEAAPNGVAAGIVKVTETDGTVSFYKTLQAAVDAAGENAVVTPLIDLNLTTVTTTPSNKYNVSINKSITIDGEGHTITSSTGKRPFVLQGEGNNITLKDLTIVNNKAEACMFIVDNLTCTLDGVTLDGTNGKTYNQPLTIGSISGNGRVTLNVTNRSVIKTNDEGSAHYSIIAWHPADITVTDSELKGWATVYIKPDAAGSTVNISNSTLTSKGLSGATNNFAMFVTESGNNEITLTDCTLNSSAVSGTYESLFILGGQDNVVKILGSTTYTTNDETYGPITYDWGSLKTNKMYFDDTTKAAFDKYFDEANGCYILDEKEQPINLYPVSYEPEVFYYWADGNGGYQGVYCKFSDPFINTSAYILGDGEFIALQKNIALNQNIPCPLAEGGITILLGDYTITKGDYSVSLLPGVTVYTDKQTDIFSAATEGYSIYELTTETGYAYTCGNYVAKVNNDLFKTFPEAATAAAGTKVILLLQDISDLYTMSVGETLRVEKAGKAFDDPAAPDNNYTVNSMIEGPVTIYSLKAAEQFAAITDGYYHIKNLGNEKYVNVKGRKTATVDATEADIRSQAGTVIKVKATNGQVEVLRSQAIDIPHYAERAMSYVPDVAKLLVEKLNATGSGEILGTTGFDAIMQKFNDSFDYHLYTEQAEGGVRIFGRTPSMKPVVEFYNEHKANVDAKLPQLESYINSAIAKVVDKVGKGSSLKESFKLHTIWERMDNNALTEPNDDATKLAFLQQVLASETNVWNFAYQTATFYMEKVEGSSYFSKLPAELQNYWSLAKQVRPDFKYYIVQKDGKMDFISEGNIDIKNNVARTIWALEPATEFDVEFNVTNKDGEGFATLYTDFGYQLPEGVTALKVTGIDADDIAQTEEIGNAVAAQTPVLLKAPTAGKQTLTIGNYGAAVSGNEIHGADYLIDQYTINEPALESLFQLLAEASKTTAEKYDYLQRKNSGTVNNKYFFPMTDEDVTSGETPIRTLTTDEEGTPVFAKTWTGVKANEAFMVSETIDPIYLDIPTTPDAPATIDEAYYRIKNLGNNQYVNVQGRKTATVDATEETAKTLPGTIIKVKSTVGVLDILRSQAVDVPRYAQRAMTYVPELAELIVEKLQATGSGEILGTTGFDAIMQKFNDSFDYHLHVVYADEEGDKYRIYGQIPTMKPVVEFYNEHKANVDYKLKDLETAVNGAIEKLVNKMGMGSSLINSFSLETIWQRMGSQLTKPADEASKLTFLQEVLSNEKNVWDFAYQTVTFYMEKVENSQYFDKLPDNVKSYWNRAKNVHPGFKYYIVQKDNKMDIISQGNIDIQNDDLRTMWTLEPVETMTVNVPEANSRIIGATFDENGKRTGFETGYYTTLYTDFAYQLPEGVVALKVTEIKDTYLDDEKLTYDKDGITLGLGLLTTKEIGQEVPAQTPVLIMSKTAGDINITIGDSYGASADVTGNLLHGADYLINEYEINTPILEGFYDLAKEISASTAENYEHLIRKNSGTVNNKYFFSLNIEDELATAYKKKTGNVMQVSPVLVLSKLEGKKLAFNESRDNIQPNAVFLFSEKKMPALFTLTGDVTGKVDNVMMPDGIIDVSDVTGQVNIVQERDKKEYNYDYEAADIMVEDQYYVDVDDVTGNMNIIQKRKKHPDLP